LVLVSAKFPLRRQKAEREAMSTFAVAHLRGVRMGPPIVEYLERIDATLAPFDGRFVVHGDKGEVLEGDWPGFLIVIEFPDRNRARAWYTSNAYQEILPLRLENAEGSAIFVDTVAPGHKATDVLG
jgi:uncharacterized protein (DUF1330 family)